MFLFQHLPVQGLLYFQFLGFYISVPILLFVWQLTTAKYNQGSCRIAVLLSSKQPIKFFCENVPLQASQTAVPKINFKIFTNN